MPAIAEPPAAPAAPSTPPTQSPASAAPIDFGADIDADLASLDDSRQPPPAPAKAPEKPTPTVKPSEKPEAAKPADKTADAKPADKPVDEPPPKPVKAADLRGAYEGLKKRVKDELEPKLHQLEARVKEYETRKPEDTAPLQAKLEAAQKRADELESEIRFVNYRKSNEFKEKYEKPYEEAWASALAQIRQLQVATEDGGTRPATDSDILALANMPVGELDAKADEMFGRSAPRVVRHIEKIRELSDAQHKALADAQKNAGEREKTLTVQQQAARTELLKLWQGSNKELAEKYPAWFGHSEDDPEGNALLDKGFALADLHFVGRNDMTEQQIDLLPPAFRDALKSRGYLTPQERVQLDARLRNKAANHDRLVLRVKRLTAELKEKTDALAEYEKSSPPAGKAGEGSAAAVADELATAEAELDKIDRENR